LKGRLDQIGRLTTGIQRYKQNVSVTSRLKCSTTRSEYGLAKRMYALFGLNAMINVSAIDML